MGCQYPVRDPICRIILWGSDARWSLVRKGNVVTHFIERRHCTNTYTSVAVLHWNLILSSFKRGLFSSTVSISVAVYILTILMWSESQRIRLWFDLNHVSHPSSQNVSVWMKIFHPERLISLGEPSCELGAAALHLNPSEILHVKGESSLWWVLQRTATIDCVLRAFNP